MSFVSISDIHIQNRDDDRYQLLLKFMRHPKTQSVNEVFFLGDIFDLMVGPHQEYLSIYHEFFSELKKLLDSGKMIHYFEGNHDLHIKKLFKNINGALKIHHHPVVLKYDNKNYYMSHGDELEPGNYSYKIYKQVLLSKPLELIATHVPFHVVEKIGRRASKLSKKRGKRIYNEEKNRERFRQGAIAIAKNGHHFIVAGHSHIKENIELRSSEGTFQYVNNGFFPNTQEFLYMQGNKFEFICLR